MLQALPSHTVFEALSTLQLNDQASCSKNTLHLCCHSAQGILLRARQAVLILKPVPGKLGLRPNSAWCLLWNCLLVKTYSCAKIRSALKSLAESGKRLINSGCTSPIKHDILYFLQIQHKFADQIQYHFQRSDGRPQEQPHKLSERLL